MKKLRLIYREIKKFIFNKTVDATDRAFMFFSVLILIALYLSIPTGLMMHEPVIATLSSLAGSIFFTAYVVFTYKMHRIKKSKLLLSILVVFIFLPAMFFTNGGASGGTPLWLLLGMIYISLILDGKIRSIMLILNILVLIVCWTIGYFYPDLVMEYSRGGNYYDSIAGLMIVGGVIYAFFAFQQSIIRREEQAKNLHRLFEQTATALVNAIDAKDKYTHGHSSRVAEYSRKIAELAGKSPEECEEIYYVALLHDVGKIGVPGEIINKPGKLTPEEREIIMQHQVLGSQILKSITEYPNLIIGARFHHERYDGKGYPEHLKGDDIPEYARIIAIADSYDAMTSKRSYRSPIPQQTVREEILKGSGTQFDPKYVNIMQRLIDLDPNYDMREKDSAQGLEGSDLFCLTDRDDISEGIELNAYIKKIRLKCNKVNEDIRIFRPSMIIFDSLDERYHDISKEVKDLNYFEYAEVWFDGQYQCQGARKIAVEQRVSAFKDSEPENNQYDIEVVRIKDHVQIKIDDMKKAYIITIALPDSSRFAYIGLSGNNSHYYDIRISTMNDPAPDDYIARIAEEISYINVPAGDIPNIQVDGFRTASTEGIPITDCMKISFHTMSLPTARLVWHCTYLDIFHSSTKMPSGDDYKEYALIRLDGENWEAEDLSKNDLNVDMDDSFGSWENWKHSNKKGFDCTIYFRMKDNQITTYTKNLGISLKNVTTIFDMPDEVYFALTGDQAAITNIRIGTATEDEIARFDAK